MKLKAKVYDFKIKKRQILLFKDKSYMIKYNN